MDVVFPEQNKKNKHQIFQFSKYFSLQVFYLFISGLKKNTFLIFVLSLFFIIIIILFQTHQFLISNELSIYRLNERKKEIIIIK